MGWCTSGGVVLAVANHFTGVVSTKGGKVESFQRNEVIIAEDWVKCQEGRHILRCFFGILKVGQGGTRS